MWVRILLEMPGNLADWPSEQQLLSLLRRYSTRWLSLMDTVGKLAYLIFEVMTAGGMKRSSRLQIEGR